MSAHQTPPVTPVAAAATIVDHYLCEICQTPIPEVREGATHAGQAWASVLAMASGRALPLYLNPVHRLAAHAVPIDAQQLDSLIESLRGTPSAWMRMLRNAWHFVVAAREKPRDKRLRGLADLAIRQLITTPTSCDYIPDLHHRLILGQRFRVVVPERVCLAATLVAWVHLDRDLDELDEGILVWDALDFLPDIPVFFSSATICSCPEM